MILSTLAGAITATDTTLSVVPGEGASFPQHIDFYVLVENEIMLCSSISTDTLTVSRGHMGTTAAAHDINEVVAVYVGDKHVIDLNAYVDLLATDAELAAHAALSSEVHGAGAGETLLNTGDMVDEDDMASNSAAKVPTQQSVKAYVDAEIGGVNTFVELTDTPAAYTSKANNLVRVNSAANALEFIAVSDTTLPVSGTDGQIFTDTDLPGVYVWVT